jgi:hypothetical protein
MHERHEDCPRAQWVEVVIEGDVPKHNGWRLIASVSNLNGTAVFMTVPGEHVSIERMKNINPQACDHCGINRQRNETHLIEHEDGKVLQMGSTCIKDFLGWDITSVLAFWRDLNTIREPREDFGSYVRPEYNVEHVIRVACDVVSVDGKYKKSEYPDATRSTVMDIIDPIREFARTREYRLMVEKYKSQPARAQAIYDATMQAWSEVTPADLNRSEWMYNLSIIMNQTYVTSRYIGILVSIVTMGMKRIDAVAQAPKVAKTERVWVGDVNGKVSVDVIITDIKYIDSNYGGSWLITMQDADGNLLKWFASSKPAGIIKDVNARVVGTVKKHDTYNGVKSTMLTRCKMEVK